MIGALAEPAPVITDEVQIKIVRGNLGLPVEELLQTALSKHEWSRPCQHMTLPYKCATNKHAEKASTQRKFKYTSEHVPGGADRTFCDPEYMQSMAQASP